LRLQSENRETISLTCFSGVIGLLKHILLNILTKYLSVAANAGDAVLLYVPASSEGQE
jgi:hypothetical protein